MKVLGQPIFLIIWRFSLLRGTNLLKSKQMVHWNDFIMRGFSLLGEFIIGGSTVFASLYMCTLNIRIYKMGSNYELCVYGKSSKVLG